VALEKSPSDRSAGALQLAIAMKTIPRFLPCWLLGGALGFSACSTSSEPPSTPSDSAIPDAAVGETPPADSVADAADARPPLAIEVPCTDTKESTFAAPTGALPGENGAIIRCSHDSDATKEQLMALSVADGYAGTPFVSGARLYRVIYRTERGTNPATPGYSSAVVYLPDHPIAAKLPLLVTSHGIVGIAAKCAPSQSSKGLAEGGMAYVARSLVGAGYAVIAPDYAGFAGFGAPGNPLTGVADSADVARSMLDAVRALKNTIASNASDQVVLIGHSQGGHTTLSALALAESLAPDLNIVATVVYTPFWFSNLAWAALFPLADSFPTSTSAFPIGFGLWYHYSHAEILDGPGHGQDLFAPSKRAAIRNFVETSCDTDDIKALGDKVTDLYDPAFINAMGNAGLGEPCGGDPTAKALCDKWLARYKADRPHLVGKAAKVPLLVLFGDKDTTITPDRAMCGFNRLRNDKANVTICVQAGKTHESIVSGEASYVNEWLAARVFGAAEPARCSADETSLTDSKGKQVTCATPPPDDLD
jgi:pimeloyl-ACP methyl ester carboxylesterase